MKTVRVIIVKFFFYVLQLYVLLRYGGIWKMKHCNPNSKLLSIYWEFFFNKYNSWIGYSADIKGVPYFPHGPRGVFISNNSIIGKDAIIFHQVTIGSNSLNGIRNGSPIIGDNCYIGAGAKLIGKITIGNNCRIGANAVVYSDMPNNSVAVCSNTRIIMKNNLDNRYFSIVKGKQAFYREGKWIINNEN